VYLHLTGKGRYSSRHSRWKGLHRHTCDVLAGPAAQDSFRQSLPGLLAAERGLCKRLSARRQEWRSRLCNDVLSFTILFLILVNSGPIPDDP
jgi:hypothetical protein